MKDFSIKMLQVILENLERYGYISITFKEYLINKSNISPNKIIIIRHDVEQHYENALEFAELQSRCGIKGTYFFRILPKHFNTAIVKKIAELGHEIGYHYDDLAQCNGNYKKAILRFKKNLQLLRNIAPVTTVCMDGSPLSKYDNKTLWQKYDYKSLGIIGEPYYDIDFNEVFYLTDTGRRWDGWETSVRDKVPQQEEWVKQGLVFHSTNDIIQSVRNGTFPKQVMFTFHPQRWNNKPVPWVKELMTQNVKNVVKRILVKNRS
jgi:hypothetical protein